MSTEPARTAGDHDTDAEYLAEHAGELHLGYRRTSAEIATCSHAIPLPYEYVVCSPAGHTLCLRGFVDREHLAMWLSATGCSLLSEPEPGEMFEVLLPERTAFRT